MPKFASLLRQVSNALRYLVRGDVSGLVKRLKWHGREYHHVKLRKQLTNGRGIVWGILCTPHTLFIARTISERLAFHGIESEIVTRSVNSFNHDFYIVLCAQMFRSLPPENKRVIFQLEQTVSSRWFTQDYMKVLKRSVGVLEYSLTNIDFLSTSGLKYPSVHYLPIGSSLDEALTNSEVVKKYDFIFYGDSLSSERRRKFLDKLQEKYSVKICNDLFGDELYAAIREARAVVNIHYYESALLEMPRICECISLGVPVLSEGTADLEEYPELEGAVIFFDEGSIDSMMACASEMLNKIEAINETIAGAASVSAARFNFMFDRFLMAIGVVPANIILDQPIFLAQKSDFLALSLPETIERRRMIKGSLPVGCEIFDGIRNNLAWIGCGCSFNALSRYALASNIDRLTIIEDDVDLPNDFDDALKAIHSYLDTRKSDWDVFSGLMSLVHPSTEVISVDQVGDKRYITINKMMSCVFNIYNERALQLLSRWNPLDTDAETNTIDRYMERQSNLRVVVSLPFVVGHKEAVTSTLWGFNNKRYTQMVADAELTLTRMADQWRNSNSLS